MSILTEASLIVTLNAYKAGTLLSVVPSSGAGDMVVARNSGATRVNSAGLIENVAVNVPRIDYTNGSCPSLLVEPQRTNLVIYSEDFSNAAQYVLTGNTVTTNATISPSGIQNADMITQSTGGFVNMASIFSSGSNKVTISIYAKKGTSNTFVIQESYYFGNSVIFNLNNGTITSGTGTIDDTGNGWYRCTYTETYGVGQNQTNFVFYSTQVGTFYMWGLQPEIGSYPTSYIPTASASVTRNADVISKTGISSLIGQTEGTLFVDFYNYGNNSTTTGCPICIANGGFYDNAIYIEQYLGNWYAVVWNGSSQQFISSPLSLSVGRHKLALAYKSNDIAFYSDGVLVGTDTSATIPTCDGAYIGAVGTSTTPEQLAVNASALWKKRLTNTQLAQLTTL